ARGLVNSGRLSVPCVLAQSPLNTPDGDAFEGAMVPGAVAADAPVEGASGRWLLDYLGRDFVLITFGSVPQAVDLPVRTVKIGEGHVRDVEGLVAKRYDGQ